MDQNALLKETQSFTWGTTRSLLRHKRLNPKPKCEMQALEEKKNSNESELTEKNNLPKQTDIDGERKGKTLQSSSILLGVNIKRNALSC